MAMLPLCVDLDGTLIRANTLSYLAARVLLKRPWLAPFLPWWLWQGKQVLKKNLSARCVVNPAELPANPQLLQFLQAEYKKGRPLFLATGAYADVATHIAEYYGFFSGIFASDAHVNLVGKNKAALLVKQFGERRFAYAGNELKDSAIWEKAGECYLVNVDQALAARLRQRFVFAGAFDLQ